MDFKVSKKEKRWQRDGQIEVLTSNIFDLYPVFADDPKFKGVEIYGAQGKVSAQDAKNYIMDVETLDGEREELLDRAMFATVKQRGNDPIELDDGIQWAEAVLGEVSAPVILQQVYSAVSREGTGVRVTSETVKVGSKEHLTFKVRLTDAVQ